MKLFTDKDIDGGGTFPTIHTTDFRKELVDAPLGWQRRGLEQTASGYGRKLVSRYKINFNGKVYRVYATCFSNAASHWFTVKGRRIFTN